MRRMTRRSFVKISAVAAAGTVVGVHRGLSQDSKPVICVVHGKDIKKMLAEGIARIGGWQKFVRKNAKVTLKPNSAWASTPEQGGNTAPDLVRECMTACLSEGASGVVVPEIPCSPAHQSFVMSCIKETVEKAGGKMFEPKDDADFRAVQIPNGKILKEEQVPIDVLDTGCLINMPVAKTHGSAILTLSMKNWMGSARGRKSWHKQGLNQCIADMSTVIKPNLIIIDATRIMTTNGPRGPGKLEYPDQIVLGTDPVAVDAYAATLFKKEPLEIPHIKIAHEMGIGCGDLSKVEVINVTV